MSCKVEILLLWGVFLSSLLLAIFPASAQNFTNQNSKQPKFTVETSFWPHYGELRWENQRASVTPIATNLNDDAGFIQEFVGRYQSSDQDLAFDVTMAMGKASGIQTQTEFCNGLLGDISGCAGGASPIFSEAKSFTDTDISLMMIDSKHRFVSLKRAGYHPRANRSVVNYHWLIGYMRFAEHYNSYGKSYLTGAGNSAPVHRLVATQKFQWDGVRLGGFVDYQVGDQAGRLSYQAKIVYVLNNLAGNIKETAYQSVLGAGNNIKISGTGAGLLSDVTMQYQLDHNKYLAVGYRHWSLHASGTQFLGPDFVKKIKVTKIETVRHGPIIRFFVKF